MPSALSSKSGNHGSRVTPALGVRKFAPTSLGNLASAQVAGGQEVATAASRVCISFFQTPSASPSPDCARDLPARHVQGTRAGLLCITKEPSSFSSRRPARPHLGFPRPPGSASSSGNWLPGPRFPGTRKGEGAKAATIGRVREKRAARSAKARRGGKPGPCRRAIGRGRPPLAAADWWILKFGLKAPEEVF